MPSRLRTLVWCKCCCCSVAESYLILCDPMDCSTQGSLSFTISQSLFKLMSFESVIPSNHPILCRPLLLLPSVFPNIRVFSNESTVHIRWPKYWSFSISPSNEYSGLISFRMDWFVLLVVQGTLKSLHHHHSGEAPSTQKASILRGSAFFKVQLAHLYWENHSFDYTDLRWQMYNWLSAFRVSGAVKDWRFVSPFSSCVEVLTPDVTVGRWQGHNSGALDGISVLRRKLSRELASSLLSTLWGHNEKMAMCKPGRRFSPETESETPSSWIPSLQNWQKYMYIVYKWTQRVTEYIKTKKWSRFLEETTFGSYAARVPFSSHLHQCLLFLVFLIKTFLTEVRWHFTTYSFYLQKGANYLFFFAMLGRLCWMWAFSSCAAQASHCSGFSCYGAQALRCTGSRTWSTWAL